MRYLEDYYKKFNEEITRYQWPDPFESMEGARNLLWRYHIITVTDIPFFIKTLFFTFIFNTNTLL